MKRNIFVGNLAWATDDTTLADHFQKIGDVVRAKVMTDMHTGKSRGFAFVTMENDEQHDEAIRVLNNTSLDGRNIIVAEAKEKPARREDGGGDYRRNDDRGDYRRNDDRGDRRSQGQNQGGQGGQGGYDRDRRRY